MEGSNFTLYIYNITRKSDEFSIRNELCRCYRVVFIITVRIYCMNFFKPGELYADQSVFFYFYQ